MGSTQQTAWYIEAGAAQNAFTSGIMVGAQEALQMSGRSLGHPKQIACLSSGAYVGAFKVCGQLHLARNIWTHEITRPEVFDPFKVLKFRPPADVDYLADHACAALNVKRLRHAPTELRIGVLDAKTGEMLFIKATPKNARTLLKATAALYPAARCVPFGNRLLVDGAIGKPLHFEPLLKAGFTRMILFRNKPKKFKMRKVSAPESLAWYPFNATLRRAIQQCSKSYHDSLTWARNPPPGITVQIIEPEDFLPCDRFERNPNRVEETFEIGRKLGPKYASLLQA